MTVALWIVTSVLVVFITMVALGMAIRPYVDQLRADRDAWKQRALEAEGRQAHDGLADVRIIDPNGDLPWATDSDREDIALWLQGAPGWKDSEE